MKRILLAFALIIGSLVSAQAQYVVPYADAIPSPGRTYSDALNDYPASVLNFIPKTLHAAIKDGTSTTDVSSYLTAMHAAVPANVPFLFPAGQYNIGAGTISLAGRVVYSDGARFTGGGSIVQAVPLSIDARTTNYAAQTPGGAISVGSNTITLAPCPIGLAGADSNHYVYLSGGTGTAEAALITGGTCTSGAATGTITVTAANTHSGAWTVSSASGGIDEAQRLRLEATIIIPPGETNTYATITPLTGTTFQCTGGALNVDYSEPCIITLKTNGIPAFNILNDNVSIRRIALRLDSALTASPGSIGILAECCTGIYQASSYTVEDVNIWRFYVGVDADGGADARFTRMSIYNSVSHAMIARGVQGFITKYLAQGNAGDGLRSLVGVKSAALGASPWVRDIGTFNNGG